MCNLQLFFRLDLSLKSFFCFLQLVVSQKLQRSLSEKKLTNLSHHFFTDLHSLLLTWLNRPYSTHFQGLPDTRYGRYKVVKVLLEDWSQFLVCLSNYFFHQLFYFLHIIVYFLRYHSLVAKYVNYLGSFGVSGLKNVFLNVLGSEIIFLTSFWGPNELQIFQTFWPF